MEPNDTPFSHLNDDDKTNLRGRLDQEGWPETLIDSVFRRSKYCAWFPGLLRGDFIFERAEPTRAGWVMLFPYVPGAGEPISSVPQAFPNGLEVRVSQIASVAENLPKPRPGNDEA